MAKILNVKLKRLQELLRRQDPPSWSPHYEPGIKATREEAPSCSRPSQIWAQQLGRYVHALSLVEQKVVLLALFYLRMFELHEQRMLSTEARPHPLMGHSRAAGLELPNLRGSIDVCDRLDMIDRHQWIYVKDPASSEDVPAPIPFLGDYLLFLFDEHGPYCVNWTVKMSAEDFERPMMAARPVKDPAAQQLLVRSRHAIEDLYYLDAGIPTVRIVERDIPERFAANLRNLILIQHRAASANAAVYQEVCERLRASMQTGQTPMEVLLSVMHRHGIDLDLARALFYRSIWLRDVRPELLDDVIFIDRPLKPERVDPYQKFGHWFARPQY